MRSREELEARLAELRAEAQARDAAASPVERHLRSFERTAFCPRVSYGANDVEPFNVIHVPFGLNPLRAYDLYSQASAIDDDPARLTEAEALYREALRCDPGLAVAMTNLGNIRWRLSDTEEAIALYREAIALDERQPEAHYNLGYALLEGRDPRGAITQLERAVALDPKFADAIFNLAMAYEQVRERRNARPLWKRYLDLEPPGTWAEIAARHLSGEVSRMRRRRS